MASFRFTDHRRATTHWSAAAAPAKSPARSFSTTRWPRPSQTAPSVRRSNGTEYPLIYPSSPEVSILTAPVKRTDLLAERIRRLVDRQNVGGQFEKLRLASYLRVKAQELLARVKADEYTGLKRHLTEILRQMPFGERTYLVADALLLAKAHGFKQLDKEIDRWLNQRSDPGAKPLRTQYLPARRTTLRCQSIDPPQILVEFLEPSEILKPMSTRNVVTALQDTGFLPHLTMDKQIIITQCRIEADVIGMKMILEVVKPQHFVDEMICCRRYLAHVISLGDYGRAVDFFLSGDSPDADREFQNKLRKEVLRRSFYKGADPRRLFDVGIRLLALGTTPAGSFEFFVCALLTSWDVLENLEISRRLKLASVLFSRRLQQKSTSLPELQAYRLLLSRQISRNKLRDAADLIQGMVKLGYKPSDDELSQVFNAAAKMGECEIAAAIFQLRSQVVR